MTDLEKKPNMPDTDGDYGLRVENPTKPALKSKGVIGGLLAAAGSIAALAGYSLDIDALQSAIVLILSGVGGILAIFGRVAAKDKIDRLL